MVLIKNFLSDFSYFLLKDTKRKVIFGISIMITAIVLIGFCNRAFAIDAPKHSDSFLWDTGDACIQAITNFEWVSDVEILMKISSVISKVNKALKPIISILKPIALAYGLVFWSVDILDTVAMAREVTPEIIMKKMIYLLLIVGLISSCQKLTKDAPTAVYSTSITIQDKAEGIAKSKQGMYNKLAKKYSKLAKNTDLGAAKFSISDIGGFFSTLIRNLKNYIACFFTLLLLIITMIICFALSVDIVLQKVGAILEMLLRGMLIPIGCANVQHGFNDAWRYFKKYLACGMRTWVMAGAISLGVIISNSLSSILGSKSLPSNNFLQIGVGCIICIMAYILVLGLCGKAERIADDAMS